MENKKRKEKRLLKISLEILLVLTFFSIVFFPKIILAGAGENNVTVLTNLTIGNSAPIINFIEIEEGSVILIPNSEKIVNCTSILTDYDSDVDIVDVSAVLFDNTDSFLGDFDDNNMHYTNNSCYIDYTYGTAYEARAHCLFDVWYYANPGEWNCSVSVTDSWAYQTSGTNTTQIQELLALGLPDTINYGTVNATYVSEENITNVTNYGNVQINLSLNGYGFFEGDGNAMNCTLGPAENISVNYEKFNLTDSISGDLSLTEFEGNYTNLTSSPITKRFDLNYRQDDALNEAWNQTYWRIYVPLGVAGTCQGNIIFGAVQVPGS